MRKLLLLFFVGLASSNSFNSQTELELVHIIFRHSVRAPSETYHNDPYVSEALYPDGRGQLTDVGRKLAYLLGLYLRRIYNGFLSQTYRPEILEAWTTEYRRCQASTELMLAGLFTKQLQRAWNNSFSRLPIPYNYKPRNNDKLFWAPVACPNYKTLFERYRKSPAYASVVAPFLSLGRYISALSGIKLYKIFDLYSTLKAQEEMGYVLPPWMQEFWPEPLRSISATISRESFGTDDLRALGAGFLLSKIMNDTNSMISGEKSTRGRKMYLYGGHDMNIMAMLSLLGVVKPHNPHYSAYVVFEIHKDMHHRHIIKIFYQNYEADFPKAIYIPNCGMECPFQKFATLYSKFLNPIHLCY